MVICMIFYRMKSLKVTLVILIGTQLSLEDPSLWMDVSFRINKLNFIWSKAIHHLNDKAMLKHLRVSYRLDCKEF